MTRNRWAIAVAGTVAMACLGTIYSWSIFTQPLIASFGWSNTTTTWTFAIAIFCLGIVRGGGSAPFGPPERWWASRPSAAR